MGGWSFNAPLSWEEEQEKREREMQDALARSESAGLNASPGSVPEPENEYLGQYAEHVRGMPNIQDFEPSMLRKILAVIGGFAAGGDPNITRRLAAPGYDEAMGDWQKQGEGLRDVAGLGEEARRVGATTRGQDVAAVSAEAGREAAALEGVRGRQARAAESEADRAARETIAGRSAEEQARHHRATEEYYDESLGIRRGESDRRVDALTTETELTPEQQTSQWRLAAQRVAARNPQWGQFVDEKGVLPFEEPGFMGWGGMDQSAYSEFVQAVEDELAAQGGFRTRKRPGEVQPLSERNR